jgi:transposase
VVGLAVVFLVAAVLFYSTRSSACTASAVIVKPEPGDTITEPIEIVVSAENTECVSRAVFTIEGREVASAEPPSFSAMLDPANVPELADGVDHALEITLIDNAGERIPQSNPVLVAFETRAVTKPEPTPSATQANTQTTKPSGGKQPSLVQINEMSQRLVKQLAGSFSYNVTNKQFLQEVQKRTAEYAQEGYFQRAAPFKDAINVAFVREQNIAAPLGFFLAMSRSKFNPARQGEFEGLWQMTNAFVTENKYNGSCGTETLSDASQNCAAKSAALYMKSMIYGVFDGDLIYSAAAFGKSPKDAGEWKATLPSNRVDVWNSIRTQAEREQLVRFFAAAIVGENPQSFGLTKDRPLSELYRVTM